MENSDLKVKTRSVSQIVKSLEEQRSKSSSITSLFSENTTALRKKLVALIESILLEDFENIGKKTRDILWRKVYYDPISTSKKIWKKREIDLCDTEISLLSNFIRDGINHYKTLILKFEDTFSVDIRYIIDFSIIANGASAFEKKSEKEIYTVNETNHALETIHSFLICLGDLHRYCIEFKFPEKDIFTSCEKQLASSYYIEAFKLNPKSGMPHNQLGTLLAGENYEINSIFHYLYSLCSANPVELSETNVSRVFQQNNEALERVEATNGFNIKDFMMQVILLIDILFYDKDISDFNAICCSVLMSFKDYLNKCRRNSQADATFQLTSIFLLCLHKLQLKNSPKVHSLNAFLVAFCSKILETLVEKIDDYIADYKDQNLNFIEEYNQKFHDFDRKIRKAREMYRGKLPNKKRSNEHPKDSGIEKNGSSNSQKDGSGSNHMSQLTSSEASQPGQVKIVKRPSIQEGNSNNNGSANHHNRRRRKRRGVSESTSEEESETESLISDEEEESDMDSNFDSYDEYDDIRFSSDEDEASDDDDFGNNIQHESDGEDVIIENEEIVYKNSNTEPLKFHDDNISNGTAEDDIVIEDEQIVFRDEIPEGIDDEILRLLKMKYKRKYTKVDPNIILKFNEDYSNWMQSLKLLFDWLRVNNEIMLGCYRSNPEFVNAKIMKLINFLNIDIFTRKIYFDRSMLKMKNVRENLRYLFDIRHQIALSEDVVFKKFPLFEEIQQPIDWTLNYKLQLTPEEDLVMRNFKLVDFGFHLCKAKKFNYNFCARKRNFIERGARRNRRGERRSRKYREERKDRKERRRNRGNRRDRRERRKKNSNECDKFERLSIKTHSQDSVEVEEYPSLEKSHQINRKGYLKTKTGDDDAKKSENDRTEMMGKLGKLWLKNEVQTLESRSKPVNTNLTPYLMLDTKSLAEYLHIVKNLVKSKKFVVLIPKAVLQDLDGLKKSKEGARNAIKWLESEFQKGNRFMRAQRESEYLIMPLLKVPSKLERDDTVFMNIVPFANFMVSNYSGDYGSDLPVLTLLTGDNLDSDRKRHDTTPSCINRAGILQSIPIKYDQIVRFYSKYKK